MRCYEYAVVSIRINIVYHKTEANATNKSYKRKGVGLLKYDKGDLFSTLAIVFSVLAILVNLLASESFQRFVEGLLR